MNNILIVDDETPIREWIETCIREYPGVGGTYTARNGEEAISILEAARIDIVFTDITMPKLNGLQLLAYIRNNNPDITVILMSVHSEFEYARSALKQGAFDYILKNEITHESLAQILNKVIAHRNFMEPKQDSSDNILMQIIRSKYLQRMLIDRDFSDDIPELRRNKIPIEDSFLFAIAMPDYPEKMTQLNLHKNAVISNATFFTYGKNKLLLIANIQEADSNFVQELAAQIQSATQANAGYSKIYPGISGFVAAAKEAIAMRNAMFYAERGETSIPALCTEDEKLIKAEIEARQNEIIEAFGANRRERAVALFKALIEYIGDVRLEDITFIKNYVAMTAHRIYTHSKTMELNIQNFEYRIHHCRYLQELRALLEEFYSGMQAEGRYSSNIRQAVEYLENNYMKQISLADIAEKVYLNEEYFSRLFKKEVGVTFTDYLTDIRMRQAKRLIIATDIKICAIAEMVGIPNNKYFSLLFKKYFDTTPSQMRGES